MSGRNSLPNREPTISELLPETRWGIKATLFYPLARSNSSPIASAERRDRKSLEEHALWAGSILYLKSVLDSIKNLTHSSRDRFSDQELGKFLCRGMTQDIDQTDLLLSRLLTYVEVTTPIRRINTVNAIIEEVLEKNKIQLEKKGVLLLKKLETNLPEIVVPDEQLKYILNSVLEYAILLTPRDGNIELLTTSFFLQRETGRVQAFFEKYGGYIEISVGFSGDRGPVGQPADVSGRIPAPQKDETLELMLRLVKGVVLRNGGKMDSDTDEKKRKTILSLRFPPERRRVFSCEPPCINRSASRPES